MSEEHAYRVAAWWPSGRRGWAKSDSAPNAIHHSAPAEFGGLEGRWTAEELLLAAIAGCYTTTVRAIAGGLEFNFTDLQVEASGTVGKAASAYNFTQVVIHPNLKISSVEERDKALDLPKRAEKLCLVSLALGTTWNLSHSSRSPSRRPLPDQTSYSSSAAETVEGSSIARRVNPVFLKMA